jgi:hypothetical protein
VRVLLRERACVAIDGSKFKAVNTRDRNFTEAKMQRRLAQIDESIARYPGQEIGRARRTEESGCYCGPQYLRSAKLGEWLQMLTNRPRTPNANAKL